MNEIAQFFFFYSYRIFCAASLVCILELLYPRSSCSIQSRIRGSIFWIAYIFITASGYIIAQRFLSQLGIVPLLRFDLREIDRFIPLKFVASIIASWAILQVSEFFYYWFHRAQHSNALLWRFHALHHSIREMNAFNSNHHFTEELLRIPFILLPMSILVGFEQPEVTIIWSTLIGVQGVFEHSSTKINWGWFRYVMPDNCFHRIHHSNESKHFNRNFGSGSAIWDLIFGTIYHPSKNEWPDVGLSDQDEPKSLQDFLFRPFYPMSKVIKSDKEEKKRL